MITLGMIKWFSGLASRKWRLKPLIRFPLNDAGIITNKKEFFATINCHAQGHYNRGYAPKQVQQNSSGEK